MRVIGEITAETFREYDRLCIVTCPPTSDPSKEFIQTPVLICSPGGDIGYTLAILDDIDLHKRTTYATGICQSAAAVLATAGEGKRICTMDTLFRFIRPQEEEVKNGDGVLEMKVPDLRYFLHTMLVARLAARLKMAKAEVDLYFDGEFISSIRAKELGMIDEVIST